MEFSGTPLQWEGFYIFFFFRITAETITFLPTPIVNILTIIFTAQQRRFSDLSFFRYQRVSHSSFQRPV